ncbi:MAG: alanine racemase [Kiloniellales bacterium]|nr:alanine racemase [Kiloniellales bacterium]
MTLESLETPCLLLDRAVMEANAQRFLDIAKRHGVTLRPHLKTAKSVEVARRVTDPEAGAPITVSTLAEAEYFAGAGFKDILYAVGLSPNKLARAVRVMLEYGTGLKLVTDNLTMAEAAAAFAEGEEVDLEFLIEIDSGDRRAGLLPDSAELLTVAQVLGTCPRITLRGVMTHAGQSYGTKDPAEIEKIAEEERAAVVRASQRLRAAGHAVDIVSLGSTPTVAFAKDLTGVTEVRCGVHVFFDLDQLGRGVCGADDLALSVLASVIGHNRAAGTILIDAGGLALSKDLGANTFLPDAGFGYVCDADGKRLEGLSVVGVSQEHGRIGVPDPSWYDRLPVGSLLRVLPNHACFTAAAYPAYQVLEDGEPKSVWTRVNGW